ncbi:MAG: hypothetical protein H6621_08640 [Halobacteriovoraceae bacterium]|nr:hypothetical protein [Halobacteriovoraceae bacterium]MCB9095120.1 hypothetical protein [Halobacteriovoraceae bacterium]
MKKILILIILLGVTNIYGYDAKWHCVNEDEDLEVIFEHRGEVRWGRENDVSVTINGIDAEVRISYANMVGGIFVGVGFTDKELEFITSVMTSQNGEMELETSNGKIQDFDCEINEI